MLTSQRSPRSLSPLPSHAARTRLIAAPALLALLAPIAACRGPVSARHLPPDQARALLLDRNWIDTLPETAQDRLHVFRFVPQMGGGVYQDRTLYAGSFELFRFEHTGEQIDFILPHRSEHRRSAYRITALPREDRDSPFDLRLDLDPSPRGPAVYYGIRAETGPTPEALDKSLRALLGEK